MATNPRSGVSFQIYIHILKMVAIIDVAIMQMFLEILIFSRFSSSCSSPFGVRVCVRGPFAVLNVVDSSERSAIVPLSPEDQPSCT